ncbi:MAG: deoxyribonuclease IV [Candidatus Roizmanbacteria bacterium]
MFLCGGHVSVAGGIEKSVERAVKETFNCMQIFTSAPRSYSANSYTEEQIYSFRRFYKEAEMQYLVQHAIYLVNLSVSDGPLRDRSKKSIIDYMILGDKIGSSGTVVHVGSKNGDESLKKAAGAIKEILSETPESQSFIIENAASQARIGSDISDMTRILEVVGSNRVKVCIDTQHLFASGNDIRDGEFCNKWIEEFDSQIGLENLICLHVNDSKSGCGSGIDRHENILDGQIGEKGLREFLSHPKLAGKPLILEVPGWDPKHKGPDRENKERLGKIVSG